ncbi:hypothetical protein BC829DRAFT_491680 [Chytridium lagenaria]|nr:hypothetical protein BC829DRAFT_491680 [Chytridium lagenaria]
MESQVVDLLAELRLLQYMQALEEHGFETMEAIQLASIHDLTQAIGFKLGHAKRLLHKLHPTSPPPSPSPSPPTTSPTVVVKRRRRRRLLSERMKLYLPKLVAVRVRVEEVKGKELGRGVRGRRWRGVEVYNEKKVDEDVEAIPEENVEPKSVEDVTLTNTPVSRRSMQPVSSLIEGVDVKQRCVSEVILRDGRGAGFEGVEVMTPPDTPVKGVMVKEKGVDVKQRCVSEVILRDGRGAGFEGFEVMTPPDTPVEGVMVKEEVL